MEKGHIPSTEYRYQVSTDPFSQERFWFSKSIGDKLRTFPFYKGLTLKGSLSKGRVLLKENASQVDVNLGCFLDFSQIAKLQNIELRKLCLVQRVKYEMDLKPANVNEGKWNIFPSSGLNQEMLGRLRLVRSIVNAVIQKQGKSYFKNSEAKPSAVWPEISIFSTDGPFSIYSALGVYEEVQDKPLESRIAAIRALSLPFGMIIDGDLTIYLKAFFDKLKSLGPETAQQKWEVVRKAIIRDERPGLLHPALEGQFPGTIEEAVKMYASKPLKT